MTRSKKLCAIALALVLLACLCPAALPEPGRSGAPGGAQAPSPVEWIVDLNAGSGRDAPGPKAWTFLVYLCGSDLGASARADLEEMATSGFDEDCLNVVAYTGGARSWGGASIPTDSIAMQEIHNGVVKQIAGFPLADMSASETLSHFLTVAAERYPADRYALILWDHGAGPNGGLFMDMLFDGNPMPLNDLKAAIGNSPFGSRKLDLIGFDACLMGGVEVAKAMEPYARYMLASEAAETDLGWNYAFLSAVGPDSTIDDVARGVIDDCFEGIRAKHPDQAGDNTLSCVDLSRMEEVVAACSAYFGSLDALLTGETYVRFAGARDQAVCFGDSLLDLMDIGCFIDNLEVGEPQSRRRARDALQSAVIRNRSDSGALGLSVYHPWFQGRNYYLYSGRYGELSLCPEYAAYIRRFTDFLTGRARADWTGLSTQQRDGPRKDVNTCFTLQLTEEQMRFMAQAGLQVFESRDGGATCALVSVIPDVERTADNAISANYVHRALYMVEEQDGGTQVRSPALPYDLTDGGLYRVEATLVGRDAGGNAVRQPVRLFYALSESDKYDGELALRRIEALNGRDGTYTVRHNIDPADFDSLEIVRQTRRPTASEGATLNGFDQWQTVDRQICRMPLDGGWKLKLLHDALDRERVYVGFAIRDYQNRRCTSSLIALQGARPGVVKLTYDNDLLELTIPFPTLDADGAKPGMKLGLRVANRSGVADALFRVANLRLNDRPVDLTVDIYGNGPNEGLLPDEEESASMLIPADELKGLGTVETLDFDMLILDASNGDSEVHRIPVHGELSLDAGAFG